MCVQSQGQFAQPDIESGIRLPSRTDVYGFARYILGQRGPTIIRGNAMKRRRNLGFLVVLCAGTALQGPAICGGQEVEDGQGIPDRVQVLLQDRTFDGAIAAIDAALAAEEGPADYLLYLKGRAFHFQRKYDDAAITFDLLLEDHPESDWSRRGRFAKAAAFARKGDYRAAELIYRDEAEYLLSTDRKQELAAMRKARKS
jgi:tetratricopeptide (TPR) repeat protein